MFLIRCFRHEIQSLLALTVRSLVLLIPRRAFFQLAEPLARLGIPFFPREFCRAAGQIEKFLGLPRPESRRMAVRVFAHLVTSLYDFFYFSSCRRREFFHLVRVRGLEPARAAVKQGRGAIILAAHLGNWELIAAALARLGLPMHAVAREAKNPLLDEIVNAVRRSHGVQVHSSEKIQEGLEILRQGGFFGIVADQNTREKGEKATFFGKRASTTAAPLLFHYRTGAPILPVTCVLMSDASYLLTIEPPLELAEKGSLTRRKKADLATMNRCLETWIREYPDQWVWFHRRWPKRGDRYF